MKPICDILIPTWNNPDFINPCLKSIIETGVLENGFRIIVINNGDEPLAENYAAVPNLLVISEKDENGKNKNLGWEKGLELGLRYSESKFVVFQNDDTHIPPSHKKFYYHLMAPFTHSDVAIVSPVTTVASGMQSIFHPSCPKIATEAPYLIFFCVMLRRDHLDAAGGIDSSLPGGDDFDLGMRMRKMGKALVIDPGAFIIHHGFKTGTRVHGDGYAGVKNGWNSREMIERTQKALIQKHGFKEFIQTIYGFDYSPKINVSADDIEGQVIRSLLNGEKKVLELGCGAQKTVPHSIGIDRVPGGEKVEYLGITSVADVTADVTEELPFEESSADAIIARHILEHCVDLVQTMKNWKKILKPGGKLIISSPDENVTRGIALDPTHVHAFTKESIKSLAEVLGLQHISSQEAGNNLSFVSLFKKESLS